MQVPRVRLAWLGSVRNPSGGAFDTDGFPHAAVLGPISDPMVKDVKGASILESVLPVHLIVVVVRVTWIHPRLPVRVYHPIHIIQGHLVLDSLQTD